MVDSSPGPGVRPAEGSGKEPSTSTPLPDRFAIPVLIAFSLLLYLLTTAYDFVADDTILLEHNPYVRSFHYLREIFTTHFWSFLGARGESTYYRPLVMFCLLLEREVLGPRPWGFHLVNVLLNALVVLFVFLLGKRLWPQGKGALWAALLFAALPVHAENVAPISGLSDLLCAVFFLAALYVYTYPAGHRGVKLGPWLAAALFLLAALCKEVALVIPLLVVFYEHFLNTNQRDEPRRPYGNVALHLRRATRYAPMFLALGFYFVVRLSVVGGLGQVLTASRLSWRETWLFGLSEIGNYTYKLVWPLHLSYAWKFQPPPAWWEPSVLFGGFVAGMAVLGFVRAWRHDRTIAFAIVWFFLTLAPALNLGGLGVTAYGERFLYIPSVAFCWLIGRGTALFPLEGTAWRRAKVAEAVLAVLVVLVTVRTALRLPAWQNNVTLAQATLAEDPNSATYHLYLGNNYRQRGDRAAARIEYVQAIALDPSLGEAYLDLAGILQEDGAEDAAREFLQRAVEANPRLAEGYFELGRQELHQHHPDLARDDLERAIALRPDYFDALSLLGVLALEAGKLPEAEDLLTRALAANPLSVETLLTLGAARARQGHVAAAEAAFQQAMELAPGSELPYLNLAALLEESGKPAAALEVYRRAVGAVPASANAQFRRGVLALKVGRLEEATQALKKAVAMQPGSALAHLQLGLAYQAAGRLPEAQREVQESLRLNPGDQAAQQALQQIKSAVPNARK